MIGHTWAQQLLSRAAQRNRLAHAYLFVGPTSVGKTSLAMHLASLLVCSSQIGRPCGVCRGCKSVARQGHPDVRLIERASDRRDITIEQVRQLEGEIALTPYEAPHKLFCVAGADLMNDAAASALLKTLEEPPPNASLVLTAADPMSLPITIRSRCQTLTLQPVPAHVIAGALQADLKVEDDRAKELATLAHGRPGWAVRATTDHELVEREAAAYRAISALPLQGPYSRMVAIEALLGKGSFLETRARALDLLSRLEGWWRDALFAAQTGAAPDLRRFMVGAVDSVPASPPEIVGFLLKIQETASRVEANVTPRLAVDHLIGMMPTIR
ncbi:MAG: polymerase delta prime subunit, partial [Chloroflexi bacterium]|nr:polymerase delta prime subunit [Chloroflexota bacterium]